MTESETIVFSAYELSSESLEALTVDQRAMFGILCLTLSELEALRKAASICGAPSSDDPDIDIAIIDHQLVFFRLIAMKLREVFNTLMLKGKFNTVEDERLKSFSSKEVCPRYNKLKKHPGYELWQRQRDKMGFHYDLEKFRGLVEAKNDKTRQFALINEKFGFQSFPYGEMLVASSLGEKADGFCLETALETSKHQGDFLQEALEAFSSIFNTFLCEFVFPVVPSQNVRKPVPKRLIGNRGDILMPLLFMET